MKILLIIIVLVIIVLLIDKTDTKTGDSFYFDNSDIYDDYDGYDND